MIKTWLRNPICIFLLLCMTLVFTGGCMEYVQRDLSNDITLVQSKVAEVANAIAKIEYGSDETINLLRVMRTANTASSPFNPYALPIGAGLTGVIAMLEALRRKEKDGRKYAEHELNNNNKKENHV